MRTTLPCDRSMKLVGHVGRNPLRALRRIRWPWGQIHIAEGAAAGAAEVGSDGANVVPTQAT